ncbi:MAG: metal ABC transporter substrate-binding protein [Planctomycetota bacterium]|nr:metal ABC transporter substrate-binding protein [Planctomycetota bacterium]
MKLLYAFFCAMLVLLASTTGFAMDKTAVVTTTSDLANIVSEIGNDRVEVIGLCDGSHDPHDFEIRPSMVIKVRKARLFILLGMGLDQWALSLIDASRNSGIRFGTDGYLDASVCVTKLEIPQGKIDGSMGDVHPYGNPHYWLDPKNGLAIAELIAKRLAVIAPDDKEYFKANLAEFKKKLTAKIEEWERRLAAFKGTRIVTYHRSWIYFCDCFGLDVACELEPKPGIPPSPSHLAKVCETVQGGKLGVLLMEPFYSRKAADFVAEKTGVKVLVCANSVGGDEGAKTYVDVIENVVNAVCSALEQQASGDQEAD